MARSWVSSLKNNDKTPLSSSKRYGNDTPDKTPRPATSLPKRIGRRRISPLLFHVHTICAPISRPPTLSLVRTYIPPFIPKQCTLDATQSQKLRTPASRKTMHTSRRHVTTTTRPRTRRVLRRRQRDIVEIDVEARMHLRTTHTCRPIFGLLARQPASEVGKSNIAYIHQAGTRKTAIVARVLIDGGTCICALDDEV